MTWTNAGTGSWGGAANWDTGAVPVTGNSVQLSGGTAEVAGGSYTATELSVGGDTTAAALVVNSGSLTMTSGVYNGTAGGSITLNGGTLAAGVLALNFGAATLNLNGGVLAVGQLFAGGSTINANGGVLRATQSPTYFFQASNAVHVLAGGFIFDTQAFNLQHYVSMDGVGAFTKRGAGTLVLNATNTYAGGTVVEAGTLEFTDISGLGSGHVTLDGGALRWGNFTSGDVSALSVVIGAGGGTFDTGNNAVTFAHGVTGAGAITKAGAGTLTLNGVNTYAGATTIGAGAVVFGQAASIGGTGASVTIASGATAAVGYAIDQAFLARITAASAGVVALQADSAQALDFTGLPSVSLGATGAATFSGTLTPAGSVYRLGGGGGTLTVATTLGGARDVRVSGAGTVALGSANTYGGTTSVSNGGILSFASLSDGGVNGSLGSSGSAAGNLLLDGGGLLHTGSATASDRLFTMGAGGAGLYASGTGALTLGNTGALGLAGPGARTLTLGGTNTAVNTLAASVGENGGATSLVKTGAGTWMLVAAAAYTGATAVNGGTLIAGDGSALGGGNLALTGGVLAMNGTFSRAVGSGNGQFSLTQSSPAGFAAYGGALTVSPGDLAWATTYFNPTSLALGSVAADNVVTWTSNIALGFAPTRTITVADNPNSANDRAVISGVLSGQSGVTLSGGGTLTLSGANTYGGATTLSGSTLTVSSVGNGGSASGLGASNLSAANLVIDSATLRYTGAGQSTNRLFQIGRTTGGATATLDASGTGALVFSGVGGITFGTTNQARTLILTGGNTAANTLTPRLPVNGSGLVSLVKNGAGTWVLGAATGNTYTGGTTINAGTLRTNNTNASSSGFGTGAVTVGSAGTVGGSGRFTGALTLSGTIAPGSADNTPGTLATGAQTWNGGGHYAFDINNATGTAGANWDRLTLSGPLTIAATSGNRFVIDIVSLTGANVLGVLPNLAVGETYTWTLLTTPVAITAFSADAFSLNASGFTSANAGVGGSFALQLGNAGPGGLAGTSLDLVFSTIPEPATAVLMIGAGALAAAAVVRRRRK